VERMKVAQRLDDGVVRCIATGPVASLKPGMSGHEQRRGGDRADTVDRRDAGFRCGSSSRLRDDAGRIRAAAAERAVA